MSSSQQNYDYRVLQSFKKGVLGTSGGGTEVIITCPGCHKPKLYLSSVGTYYCFYGGCEVKGKLLMSPFQRAGGPAMLDSRPGRSHFRPPEDLYILKRYKKELKRRHISANIAAYAGIYPSRVRNRPAVVLPVNPELYPDSNRWIARCMDDEDPKYLRSSGGRGLSEISLYLHEGGGVPHYWTGEDGGVLYIIESELDVLCWLSQAEQLHVGRQRKAHKVVSLGGANSMTHATEMWLKKRQEEGTRLVWVLDNDAAGAEAMAKHIETFKSDAKLDMFYRPSWPKSPGDWNDWHWQEFWRTQFGHPEMQQDRIKVYAGGEAEERMPLGCRPKAGQNYVGGGGSGRVGIHSRSSVRRAGGWTDE